MPSLYGEKIVLRLLQRDKAFSLESYQMPAGAKRALREALGRWQGLVLITGPTGSGKTTLLYSAISELDAVANNIHTVEDPVEYALPGITQTSVGGNVSFAAALKALMRQDPDAILVGEIRDEETAHAAMHAAATGHLVFSTIHANSALESVSRLVGLGIAEERIEEVLLFASAQRLVPKNCPDCLVVDEEGASLAKQLFEADILPKRSTGCMACDMSMVQGQALLFEYAVSQRSPKALRRCIVSHGSLRESAQQLVQEGVISVHQASAFN